MSSHIIGIGGVFVRCPDPERTRAWYRTHFGLPGDRYGVSFRHLPKGHSVFSAFAPDTTYFGPDPQDVMINFIVRDLATLLPRLREAGVVVHGEPMVETYGTFIHITDCDGRRVELWEPVDDAYESLLDADNSV